MGLTVFLRHEGEIDLVLTDVVMPHSGVEMAEEILRIKPEVPIVFMSGTPRGLNIEHVRHSHFLEKPFGIERLLQGVQACLHVEVHQGS